MLPRNANAAASPDHGCEPTQKSGAATPDIRSAEDRHDLELLPGATLERQVVRVPAASLVAVEQLVIEDVQTEIDRAAQFWPTFVRIIRGMAVKEMTTITRR